jgi:dipeptidase E
MSGRRPRIVAMGGGGFSAGFEDAAIDLFALSLTGRSVPRICLLATASGDPEEQIGRFYSFFHGRACDPSHVSLFRLESWGHDLREHLMSQDLIYVGGGSLLNLVAIWRAHGLDRILRDAWQAGVVLCGLSAGSMCWFEHGVTTSKGEPEPAHGLGFLRGSNSVHWSSQPARRRVYRHAVRDGMPAGYGVDDGAALVFKGTRLHEVVAARRGAYAYRIELDEHREVSETRLAVRRLELPAADEQVGTPAEVLELRAVRRGAELARRHARRVG